MDTTQTNNTTPKEKAAWLVLKYMSKVVNMQTAKECALVTVDELIDWVGDHTYMLGHRERGYHFWREVKQEIEKL